MNPLIIMALIEAGHQILDTLDEGSGTEKMVHIPGMEVSEMAVPVPVAVALIGLAGYGVRVAIRKRGFFLLLQSVKILGLEVSRMVGSDCELEEILRFINQFLGLVRL